MVNYGVSKHYAGSMVSDRCPLGYLFLFLSGCLRQALLYFQIHDISKASKKTIMESKWLILFSIYYGIFFK